MNYDEAKTTSFSPLKTRIDVTRELLQRSHHKSPAKYQASQYSNYGSPTKKSV